MSRTFRLWVALLLALLAGVPGTLLAACGHCHPCCQPLPVPSMGAPPCCASLKAAPPELGLTESAPLAASAPVTTPAEVPGDSPGPTEAVAEPLPSPPPLHEGIRLHTLIATFLI